MENSLKHKEDMKQMQKNRLNRIRKKTKIQIFFFTYSKWYMLAMKTRLMFDYKLLKMGNN